MANTFATIAPQIPAVSLGLLNQQTVLAHLVTTDLGTDYDGFVGDTVNVKAPAQLTARTRAIRSDTGYTMDDLTEATFPVQIDTEVYSGARIRDAELTFDIKDFAAQVLSPQTSAVARGIDSTVAAALAATTFATPVTITAADPLAGITTMMKALDDKEVPDEGRILLIGTGLKKLLLDSNSVRSVDASGSPLSLRRAIIGDLYGFTVVVSTKIGQNEAYGLVKSGLLMPLKAPAVPDGAPFGRGITGHGLALRWIRDYDPTVAGDRSIVSVYTGAKVYTDPVAGGGRELKRIVKGVYTSA